MNTLRLAFGLLTAVPVGSLPDADRRSCGRAMLVAPVTALPALMVLLVTHLLVARVDAPPLLSAALALVAAVLVTRGLHLDGLADTADGLSAGYDRDTALRAMRAGDTGPSGAAAVVLALLVQATALAALLPTVGGLALAAAAWLVSRHTLAWACRDGVPPARPEGLGALVAGSVGTAALASAGTVVAITVTAGVLVVGGPWWAAVGVLVAGIGVPLLVLRRCTARFGGVTGDVLGAMVETGLASGLAVGALLAR